MLSSAKSTANIIRPLVNMSFYLSRNIELPAIMIIEKIISEFLKNI